MKQPRYNARELWFKSVDEIWALPEGPMELVFDDGDSIETTNRATIFSYYCGVYHRAYPDTPLTRRHHICNGQLVKGTELELMSNALYDCKKAHSTYLDHEHLSKLAFETINQMYSDFTYRLMADVSTVSILDYVDVVDHPEVKEIIDNTQPTRVSVDRAYDKVWDVLTREGEFKGNTISRMAKTKLVSKGQILQCICMRGFATDIDSNILKRPLMSNFTRGHRTLYESMAESRSASKAIIYNHDYVKLSEYFSREMQLLSSILTRVHHNVDCGSTDYVDFRVRANMRDNDLERLVGKYYLKDDGTLGEVHETDRHLIGKTIKLRSPLKCQHKDSYGVCGTCIGALADSIPEGTNLGHFSIIVLAALIGQNILSTKHLDQSSNTNDFEVSDYDKAFIRAAEGEPVTSVVDGKQIETNTVIKLARRLAHKKVKLRVMESEAENLPDIEAQDLDQLAPSNVSSLTDIWLVIEGDDGFKENVPIPVAMGTQQSWLTQEALAYIKEHGYRLTEALPRTPPMYEIDLEKWDVSLPVFQLPFKNADMIQYLEAIKTFIMDRSSGRGKKHRQTVANQPSVDHALAKFHDIVSDKLSINIVHLENIVLSLMVRHIDRSNKKFIDEPDDYRLPRPTSDGEIGSFQSLMQKRSFGTSMAHEGHGRKLVTMDSFLLKNRPDSPFDTLLVPFPDVNPRD